MLPLLLDEKMQVKREAMLYRETQRQPEAPARARGQTYLKGGAHFFYVCSCKRMSGKLPFLELPFYFVLNVMEIHSIMCLH